MPDRLVRTLTPEVKVLSATDGSVEYVASDASLDCYREILVPQGVDFSRFVKNAPFVDSHDYSCIDRLLGSVESFEVRNAAGGPGSGLAVVERVRWALGINPLADLGFKLTESGHLKAVSVGFLPVKMIWRDEPEFVEAVKELKLSADTAAQCRCIHRTWQQIELSACIIGANPNALAKAFSERALSEADLASIGFHGEAEFEFLQLCAESYDGADQILRGMMQLELHRIYRICRAKNLSPTQRSKQPSHHAPGGDEKARRQADEQREKSLHELLTALKAVPLVTQPR
jgi:hypothetical protein